MPKRENNDTKKGRCILNSVDELINQETGSWDVELLKLIFWDIDVQHITSVPLTRHGMDDFVSWNSLKRFVHSPISISQGMPVWEEFEAAGCVWISFVEPCMG